MEAACSIDVLPDELLHDILSGLDWWEQLAVRRVSRRWRAAVDECLARRQELCISGDTPLGKVMRLLEGMPNLLRLDMTQGHRSVSLNCASVDRLFTSCPHLQEVILGPRLDESGVVTLLRRLPGLRVLEVNCSGCEGPSRRTRPAFRGTGGLGPTSARQVTLCPQLQEFDLGRASVEVLAVVFASCPQLKQLSLYQVGCTRRGPLQLTPCPQLCSVSVKNVYDEVLEAVLAASPLLEVLLVDGFTLKRNWTRSLSHCPQLRFLNIYNEGDGHPGIDLYGVLNACRLLERLVLFDRVLKLRQPGPGPIDHGHQFGLTHLDLRAKLNDNTFRRLADLLPSLRHLKLFRLDHLKEKRLANSLRRFTSLQVLHLDSQFILRPESRVLAALSDLPLEKLRCRLDRKPEALVLGVASVLRHCTKLDLLYLPDNQLDSCTSLANQLAANPPMQNEVTLVLKGLVPADAELMPSNVRIRDDHGISSHFYR